MILIKLREAYPKFSTTVKNWFKTEVLVVNWSKELALIPRAKDGSLGRKQLVKHFGIQTIPESILKVFVKKSSENPKKSSYKLTICRSKVRGKLVINLIKYAICGMKLQSSDAYNNHIEDVHGVPDFKFATIPK